MPEQKTPVSGAFWLASLMYFCSGKPMHFCSGVDIFGAVRRGEPVKARQRALKATQAGKGQPAGLKLLSASRAQSFYTPGSSHLGSLTLRHLHRLQVDQRAELGPLLLDRDQ